MKKLTNEEISRKKLHESSGDSGQRFPLTVLVDNVRSLYNVGSIFRSSDGAMISSIILAGFTPRPPRKEIEKTALGATETVPWSHTDDPVAELQSLKRKGITLCCLEQTDASIPYYHIQPRHFPLCLVLGNEVTGVSPSLVALCDLALEIPMFGRKHSLNVAVAYGIAVFHLSRVWREQARH